MTLDRDIRHLVLAPVSETLFIPLYALALESAGKNPILVDEGAIELTEKLNAAFAGSKKRIHQKLAKGRLPKTLLSTLNLRVRHFDQRVAAFLQDKPDGIVVSLGCGLSRRRLRTDNTTARWFELDLPPVIELRRRFIAETDRARCIPSSVLDFAWMDQLPDVPGDHFLFVAEGLLMYLEPEDVRALVVKLRERFAGAELLAEVSNQKLVGYASGRMARGKLRRQFGLSQDVWFHSGLAQPQDMEAWSDGIRLLSEWSFFDEDEPRLNWMRPFARWDLVARAQYVVHYRLGGATDPPPAG